MGHTNRTGDTMVDINNLSMEEFMAECNSLSTVATTVATTNNLSISLTEVVSTAVISRTTEASTVAINSLSTVVTTAAILTVMEGEQALSTQLTSLPSLTAAISNHTMVAISNLSMVYNSLTMVDTMDLNTMADKYMGEN